jgi:hypothetical protein
VRAEGPGVGGGFGKIGAAIEAGLGERGWSCAGEGTCDPGATVGRWRISVAGVFMGDW